MVIKLWGCAFLVIPCINFGSLFNLLLVLSLPKRIRILTDDNELELVQKVMLSKIPTGKYEYVISITKKGMELLLTEAEIEKYVSARIWAIIE